MSIQARALTLLIVLLLGQSGAIAASKPLELKWNELAPLISGHIVQLDLSEGVTVTGEAVAIREDMLVLDVKSSSKPQTYGKGSASIPRNSITLIKLQRTRGTWGRTTGTIIGVIAGLGLGGNAAVHTDSGGAATAVLVGITAGVTVIGYYAGRALDRRSTLIKIVP